MERLRCVVERITYQNETNGFSVIKCRAKGHSDLVTVTGAMPEVHVGSVLNLTGNWRIDAKYGQQFVIGNSNTIISSEDLSEILLDAVQRSSLVERVEIINALKSTGIISCYAPTI